MDEYFCPNCGAILNDQAGFDPSYGTWTCTVCGTELMDDDTFEGDTYKGVAWYCDECGALLNRQPGFSDSYDSWTCTECGHSNGTTEDDIYDSREDYEDRVANDADDGENNEDEYYGDGDSEDGEDEYYEDDDDHNSSHTSSPNRPSIYMATVPRPKAGTSFFLRHWKGSLLTILILTIIAGLAFAVKEFQKRIPITYSSDELIGANYEDVITKLKEVGFTRVWAEAAEDLDLSDVAEENKVYEIAISGETEFDSKAKYPYDIEIIIKYHILKRVLSPLSSKGVKGMNYLDVVSAFRDAGFINIRTTAEYDVIIGWITKDGETESITINGENSFETGMGFRPDAEIIITYHTYRSNKKV